MQLGLFAPQTPEPSRLDVTLARLRALVGEDRAGSPVLDDTHRPGSFHMEEFAVTAKTAARRDGLPRLVLRRARPPIPVRVVLRAMQPVAFQRAQNRYEVQAAYGPWRSSGCWWSVDGWDTEEWDVLAADASGASSACLLVSNRVRDEWHLEAFYD
jgi:protein ImuB